MQKFETYKQTIMLCNEATQNNIIIFWNFGWDKSIVNLICL